MGASPGSEIDDDRTRVRHSGPVPRSADADPDRTVVKAPAAKAAPLAPATPPPLPRPRHALALPAAFRLHEYRIDRVLGQGGFGITYLATDVHLDAPVAVKEYLPEEIAFRTAGKTVSANATQHRERYRRGLNSFLNEGRTLASFRHPNIVRVARFFEAHQTAYMVLEYERGSPLKQWWPAHAALPEKALMRLLQPLLDGLAVVHAAGVLHRDIKPDNIQVRAADGSLVLLDFGSARQAVGSTTLDDVAVTPGYAPLEQYVDGPQGPWTDIYAFGATLYWMVAGRKPPEPQQRLGADPMVPAVQAGAGRFSPEFLAAIDWALQPRADARPQDIAEWRAALFAAHAASLGLQEALRAGDTAGGRRAAAALRRMLAPSAWPLALKMTVAMVLTALLPMALTGYYNLQGSLAAVSSGELRNLEELARSTAGRLSQLTVDSRNLARSLGTDAVFADFLAAAAADAAPIRAKLEALQQAHPDLDLLMLMDTDGTAVVSNDPAVMGRNFRFREYFKAAMAGRGHATGIVVGAVAGAAGVFFSHPVIDGQGRVLGAVVLRVRSAAFASILDDVRAGSPRTPFLIDGDGVLIYHPDSRLLYSSLVPLSAAQLGAIRSDQRFRRSEIHSLQMPVLAQALVGARQQGHVSYRSAITQRDEIAGYAPVPEREWVVGVGTARDDFEAPLRRLFNHLLVSIGLVGLLALGLALRFARSIVRPIRALTGAAEALKRGDYGGANVSVAARDEIGVLARTFNVMIDVLREREREHNRAAPAAGPRA